MDFIKDCLLRYSKPENSRCSLMTKHSPHLPVLGTVVTTEWSAGIAQFLVKRDSSTVTTLCSELAPLLSHVFEDQVAVKIPKKTEKCVIFNCTPLNKPGLHQNLPFVFKNPNL